MAGTNGSAYLVLLLVFVLVLLAATPMVYEYLFPVVLIDVKNHRSDWVDTDFPAFPDTTATLAPTWQNETR